MDLSYLHTWMPASFHRSVTASRGFASSGSLQCPSLALPFTSEIRRQNRWPWPSASRSQGLSRRRPREPSSCVKHRSFNTVPSQPQVYIPCYITDWSQQVRPMRKNASQVQIVGTHRVSLVSARHRSTTRRLSNNPVLRMHNYIRSKKIQKKETRWYQLPRGHQMHLSKS
jgi:hypothetical protein